MSHRLGGLLTGALALALTLALVPAASATTVSVRIVGDGVGIDSTTVDTTGAALPGGCAGNSAGEAIDKAVDGNWDRQPFVSTILGESHTYAASDYWSFWINDTYAQQGICDYSVHPGDRVLMFVQRDDANFAGTIFPLTLTGVPAAIVEGQPFTVTVNEQRTDGTTTTPTPVAGATVSGGGVSAVTDAAGHATLTINAQGQQTLRATRPGNVLSEATRIIVSPIGRVPDEHVVVAISAPDRSAPAATILGIREGQRFTRTTAPRRLRASVAPDPSGLLTVKLRLSRTDRGHVTYFSGKSERFKPNRKGVLNASGGAWFAVGSSPQVDYLLPSKLPRGRYVLDVNAIDKSYNRDDKRRRGANRVVFHVG
jgi:hypothetical protein